MTTDMAMIHTLPGPRLKRVTEFTLAQLGAVACTSPSSSGGGAMTTALQGAEFDVLPDDSELLLSHLNHPTAGSPTPTIEVVLPKPTSRIGPRSSRSSIASRVRSRTGIASIDSGCRPAS